ncbi:transposase family protein [Aquimarina sp. RZ0]|nr:transposase family protein [Aquimarina sp. RZ0]
MIATACSIGFNNSFIKHFSNLEDPRTTYRGNLKHPLIDIVFLVIAAVVSGSDGWKSIELFGKSQIDWLQSISH